MKLRDLDSLFKKNGWWFLRSGGNHDIVTDGIHKEVLPRHKEINERLARAIIKKWDLK